MVLGREIFSISQFSKKDTNNATMNTNVVAYMYMHLSPAVSV